MKFAAVLAFFLLGLAMVFANGDGTVIVGAAQSPVAVQAVQTTNTLTADVDSTITVTKTVQEQRPKLKEGIVRITTIPTVIPTTVPTTTPVTFIGYAEWTSSASSLSPFNFW